MTGSCLDAIAGAGRREALLIDITKARPISPSSDETIIKVVLTEGPDRMFHFDALVLSSADNNNKRASSRTEHPNL